ncbi:zinc metalloproteinase nas-6-like, partial [Argonauta hians]
FDPAYPEEVPGMFQGDIDLDGRSIWSRNAVGDLNRRWPKGVIPFTIHSYFKDYEQEKIRAAIKHIQEMTRINGKDCIKFINKTEEDNYVYIGTGKGCHSAIGYKAKIQGLSLGVGCRYKGIIVHELLHTVGFYHEQSRPDRGSYVKINMSNVKHKAESNFLQLFPPIVNTQGLPYDYNSIMHYNAYEFAIDRSIKTVIPLKKGVTIGQRIGMSQLDVVRVQRLYGCPERKIITRQPAGLVTPSCTFDSDLCGWTHAKADASLKNNTWIRQSGETSTWKTGPSADHTFGTFEGYYLYTEASSNANSMAKIRTPIVKAGEHCLSFWYHMYGREVGSLTVRLISNDIKTSTLFKISGNQGDAWLNKRVTFVSKSDSTIEFESFIGLTIQSDIAIDDVIVFDKNC